MEWTAFVERLLPKVRRLTGLGETCISRNAAGQMLTAAVIVAAERKVLEGPLLEAYMALCEDSDVVIRKAALTHLKLLFDRLPSAEAERLFVAEVGFEADGLVGSTFDRSEPRHTTNHP